MSHKDYDKVLKVALELEQVKSGEKDQSNANKAQTALLVCTAFLWRPQNFVVLTQTDIFWTYISKRDGIAAGRNEFYEPNIQEIPCLAASKRFVGLTCFPSKCWTCSSFTSLTEMTRTDKGKQEKKRGERKR